MANILWWNSLSMVAEIEEKRRKSKKNRQESQALATWGKNESEQSVRVCEKKKEWKEEIGMRWVW